MNMIVATIMTPLCPVEGIIDRYLDHLRVRNLRHWTIYGRARALARLTRWAGGPVLYLMPDQLARWQAQRSREIQPEPCRTELSHVRQFYRWCVREGFLDADPTARLDMPRVARRLPRPIRDAALADAMAAADPVMLAILALAAFAGLRACEIATLDWSEVCLDARSPHVRVSEGKGGHSRLVPLSSALAVVLQGLPHRRGPVIPRLDGRAGPNSAHRISQRANDYLHDLGIADSLHCLRHRFATAAYQACHDLRAVQELLGHASPRTTAVYAAASDDVARHAVDAAGQLAA